MSTAKQPRTQDFLDACARRLDAALRPLNNAELARRGITRDQFLAELRAPARLDHPNATGGGGALPLEMLAGAEARVRAQLPRQYADTEAVGMLPLARYAGVEETGK